MRTSAAFFVIALSVSTSTFSQNQIVQRQILTTQQINYLLANYDTKKLPNVGSVGCAYGYVSPPDRHWAIVNRCPQLMFVYYAFNGAKPKGPLQMKGHEVANFNNAKYPQYRLTYLNDTYPH